ncbi:MAG TPA: SUMF1/EgtB/PvdO family nonheme iron enzyme [Roseiflexaceae bacterium]|nr:SUMF1/EgtB/PvdO family nonheme iron enzyme [Roseiflexaceae bacterium]
MAPTPVPTAAPTPVPTAAPALEPLPAPAGALVFEDDFGAGPEKSGLVASWAAPELTLSVASGAYSMQLAQPVDTRWMLLPRVAAGDFSLQIDLADTSVDRSGSAAAGVVFRARDGRNFYALLIDARTGRYSIRKQEGGSWSELIPWKPAAQIRQGSEVNQLRLDAQGESFTIYLNGALIDRFRDGAFASGMVGTIVDSNGAAQPQLQFDNLKLWSSDPPPPPSNLPATRQNAIGIDMVLIPGGEFIMGSNDDPNALPHMVMLPDFYIDRKEVTNIIYVVCADAQGCALPAPVDSATRKPYFGAQEFNTYPVINVTWEQARYYCEAQQKRLPTEAEWEKAASWNATTRAKSIWPWGDQFTAGRLNSAEANQGDTVMVGTYAAEQNGTFDLAGNAAEWTSTLNRPYPYDGDDGREDLQTTDDRIVRGGSWAQPQEASTGHARRPHPPAAASNQIGFRCVAGP